MKYYRIMLSEETEGKIKQSAQVLEEEDMYKFLQKWGAKKQGIKTLLITEMDNVHVEAFFKHDVILK